MSKITLLGEPRTTNHFWKNSCHRGFSRVYISADGKALKESYQYQAKSQWKKKSSDANFEIFIDLYFGTKRKCDIDNYGKILLDSLTGIIWDDDSQIQKMTVQKHYDKGNARIEIDIYQISE